LSLIHFYLNFGKGPNSEKNKICDQLESVLEKFLQIKPQKTFEDKNYFTEDFMDALGVMENVLYPKEFSYANYVRESYSSKNVTKGVNIKDEKVKIDKLDKEDEEDKDEENQEEEESKKHKETEEEEESDEDSFDKLIEESSNDSNKEI
jgi:hypothetical protein